MGVTTYYGQAVMKLAALRRGQRMVGIGNGKIIARSSMWEAARGRPVGPELVTVEGNWDAVRVQVRRDFDDRRRRRHRPYG